jgi:hypothetical protein
MASKRFSSSKKSGDSNAHPVDPDFERAILERLPPPNIVSVGLRLVGTAALFAITWRAIHIDGATALSLLLPLASEIAVAIILGFSLGVIVRDPKFRRELIPGAIFWSIVVVALLAWQFQQAQQGSRTFGEQLVLGGQSLIQYILANGMHWAMLAAASGLIAASVSDVADFKKRGPPFVYLATLGLGLRIFVMIVLGFWLFLAFDSNRRQRAELVWGILLFAELVATGLPWLVQKQMRDEKAAKAAPKQTN